MKPKDRPPWYATHPKELWTDEDFVDALASGWKPTPRHQSKTLDQAPISVPVNLAPSWSPWSPPKRVGEGARGRAVDCRTKPPVLRTLCTFGF